MIKISKEQARYTSEAEGEDECRDCRHFQVLAPRRCEAVEGIIASSGWCKLFARKSRMAKAMKEK